MVPTRYVNLESARETHGPVVDRLGPALLRRDPRADEAVHALAELGPGKAHAALERALAIQSGRGPGTFGDVPEAMRALVAEAAELPLWADETRMARAGQLLFRAGIPGGVTLGAKSLLLGYTSPAGNKPLLYSGALTSNVSRRLAETSKFVSAVAEPGGLLPGGEGFAITLRVRLIHAQVRSLIDRTHDWRTEDWGEPINQHDMMATVLLFSNAWLDGIEALGVHLRPDEAEDYVHLWRVAGHILGVEHDLLAATRAEGDRLAEIVRATQGPPDDDSRTLVRAFFEGPVDAAPDPKSRKAAARRMQAYAGLTRFLLGDEVSDGLALPKDNWRFAAPALREIVRRAERLRRRVPGGERLAVEAGRRHWKTVVELGLDGIPADFGLPSVLGRAA